MISPDTLRLYDELVATRPGLERRGKTMPYVGSLPPRKTTR